MQVNNTIPAFGVWTNYTKNVTSLRRSMSRLSSGSRMTNAGDDPSGLAMSEHLRAQKRSTADAASNVENKLNSLQTADSWAQRIHDMLGRMGELAVMANDGTKSTVDRANLQGEFESMQNEIVGITDGASAKAVFGGNALFQNSTGAGVQIDLQKATATVLGTSTWANLIDKTSEQAVKIGDQKSAAVAIGVVAAGIDYISSIRADIGAEKKKMEHTLDGLRTYEENIGATESRIRDVDIALETSELSRYSILQQIGTAVTAQANQMQEGVLRLLK